MSKVFNPTVQESLTQAPNRFFLPFGLFDNQPDPGPEADTITTLNALGQLVPVFETVQLVINSRRPEFAIEDVQVVRLDVQSGDVVTTRYVGVRKENVGTEEYRAKTLQAIFALAGIPTFDSVEAMEAKAAEFRNDEALQASMPEVFKTRGKEIGTRPVAVTVSFVENRVLN